MVSNAASRAVKSSTPPTSFSNTYFLFSSPFIDLVSEVLLFVERYILFALHIFPDIIPLLLYKSLFEFEIRHINSSLVLLFKRSSSAKQERDKKTFYVRNNQHEIDATSSHTDRCLSSCPYAGAGWSTVWSMGCDHSHNSDRGGPSSQPGLHAIHQHSQRPSNTYYH